MPSFSALTHMLSSSLFVLLVDVFFKLSHAESFCCLENSFALLFSSAVYFFSKCLKISVHPVPASFVPDNHEVIEGKHSMILLLFF